MIGSLIIGCLHSRFGTQEVLPQFFYPLLKRKHRATKLTVKMGWSLQQQARLGLEKDVLDTKLKNVTWINPTSAGDTRVEWRVNTNNGNSYTLRVYLASDFPNSCPVLVVSSPSSPLRKKDGSLLNSDDGRDHVYSAHDGLTKICHFIPDKWTSENTIYQVLMKGRIWLEAYEIHLRTGEYLDKYLAHMQ